MITKVSRVITVALVLVLLFTSTAFATGYNGILTSAVKVNNVIDQEIGRAIDQADNALVVYQANVDVAEQMYMDGVITQESAEKRILRYEAALEFKLDSILNTLVSQTESQANAKVRAAYNNGICILKEYIEVNIAGSPYLIDPLRIVGN